MVQAQDRVELRRGHCRTPGVQSEEILGPVTAWSAEIDSRLRTCALQ